MVAIANKKAKVILPAYSIGLTSTNNFISGVSSGLDDLDFLKGELFAVKYWPVLTVHVPKRPYFYLRCSF